MISANTSIAQTRYREFVESAVGEETQNPFEDVYGGMILGGEMFIKEILGRLEDGLIDREEVSYRKELCASVDVDLLLGQVCARYNCLKQDLPNHKKARKMAIYLLKRQTPLGNREIGMLLGGLSYSGVSKAFQRISVALEVDEIFRGEIECVVRKMTNVQG